jgi:hypothetical protein
MSQVPPTPHPPQRSASGQTREQKLQLLYEELTKLNAQLEYLKLMLKIGAPRQ